MGKRSHSGSGKQAVYSGGVAVCMPWINKFWKPAQVALHSVLIQEPDELILCNIRDRMPDDIRDWFIRLRKQYPKTMFKFQGVPGSFGDGINACVDFTDVKYLIIQTPTIVHIGYLINALVTAQASPYPTVALPRIYMTTLLEAASIPPLKVGNHRLAWAKELRGEHWSHHNAIMDKIDPLDSVLVGHERPVPYFWCASMKRELFLRLGGFKENNLYPCADDEMVMSLLANGVKINGSGGLVALCIETEMLHG